MIRRAAPFAFPRIVRRLYLRLAVSRARVFSRDGLLRSGKTGSEIPTTLSLSLSLSLSCARASHLSLPFIGSFQRRLSRVSSRMAKPPRFSSPHSQSRDISRECARDSFARNASSVDFRRSNGRANLSSKITFNIVLFLEFRAKEQQK